MNRLHDEILTQLAEMAASQGTHPWLWRTRPADEPVRTIDMRWRYSNPRHIQIHPVLRNQKFWVDWGYVVGLLDEGASAKLWNRSEQYGDIPFIRIEGTYANRPITIDVLSQPRPT